MRPCGRLALPGERDAEPRLRIAARLPGWWSVNCGGYNEEDDDVSELTRPTVEVPEGPAPTDLVIEDQVIGDGPEAIVGSQIRAHYVGVAHSSGRKFDASWDRGSPLEFRLGTGRVIKGWDDGIVGMRVGGRRRLTIPPHLAYGDRGAGAAIKPGETLVFVVDLVSVS
jgi:peptidylprolyl isomerase